MNAKFLSRKVTCNSHGQDSSYFMGWQEYERNPYHHINNPSGIIQMGLAENQLSFDLLETWLASHPEATNFKNAAGGSTASLFRELALFQDYHGLPHFKLALASFMSELRENKVKFDPEKLVLTAGGTSANETLVFCLCNPGDAFLLPTPYYPGFDRDLKWRTGAHIIPIHCSSSNAFRITKPALLDAFRRATKLKLPVKGVLITNPSNPLGTTLTPAELHALADFIQAKNLHLICDEIYSGTNFTNNNFLSITHLLSTRPHLSNQVHIVYSLSKDLGLPGFRVGAIYSHNHLVLAAATKMSSFGLVSSQTQHLLALMLGDRRFVRSYIVENKRRLKERHSMLVDGLRGIGIQCLESNAGLFCWVDMRHLLAKNNISFQGEMELWKRILFDVGLNISPGSSCHCAEPGWFRVCFANMTEATLALAVQRLGEFVESGGTVRTREYCRVRPAAAAIARWVRRLSAASERRVEQQLSR